MQIIQGTTPRGSLTNCVFVVDDNGNAYCFSYGSQVAAIINDEYVEYNGPMYYSRTSCRHKATFRRYFNVQKGESA